MFFKCVHGVPMQNCDIRCITTKIYLRLKYLKDKEIFSVTYYFLIDKLI